MHVFLSNFSCRKSVLNLGSAAAPVPGAHAVKLPGI